MVHSKKTLLKNLEGMSLNEFANKYYRDNSYSYDFIYDNNIYIDIVDEIQNEINELDELDELDIEGIIHNICENAYDTYMYEFIDGLIDIYYTDLMNWLSKHYFDNIEWMELPVEEGLIDFNNYNFTNHIQLAQWYYYQNEINNEWENITDELIDYFEEGINGRL